MIQTIKKVLVILSYAALASEILSLLVAKLEGMNTTPKPDTTNA
jgi:hypothetical protein